MILNKGAMPEKPHTLSEADKGTYFVEQVTGPDQHKLRLHEMGIIEGAPVAVLSCSKKGMRVIKVGGSRLALSKGSTDNIWVRNAPVQSGV